MANLPPPDIAAHAARVQAWLDGEEAAARDAANRGPTAAERYDAIRRDQAQAMSEGRVLPIPAAPAPVPARTDLTLAERWGAWRDPRA
jgi:hypothetical protein